MKAERTVFDDIADDLAEDFDLSCIDPAAHKKKWEEIRERNRLERRKTIRLIRKAGGFRVIITDPNSGAAGQSMEMFLPKNVLDIFWNGPTDILEIPEETDQ